jgi:N-acetylglucosaminyl-diphospho-decaprenol L-rhamnosyltransferase
MDLSIICVNWNSLRYLRDCIASIYEHTVGITFEVVIVDNASPEGRVETLLDDFPTVRIFKSDYNVGFARANNIGFKHSSGLHVLLLNPDTTLVGPAITTLLNWLQAHPDAGIVGCRNVNPDLSIQTTTIQTFPTILNQLLAIERLKLFWPNCPLWSIGPLFSSSQVPVAVEVIPGACMLMTRDLFAKVGMFSEEYFMYGEDIDLNYKVAQAGFTNYYIPAATIIHYGGRSSTQQTVSQWATTMKHGAMMKFYVTTRGTLYASVYRAAMGASASIRLLLLALAYPLGNILVDKRAIVSASGKWLAVLKWAVRPQDCSPNAAS